MRMYGELASWFHLISHPDEYAAEADHVARIVDAVCGGAAKTLLELGSGGGNNASHLKRRFTCTLSDLSPAMLELSATINPECEHVVGDMRTLRLGRLFDVVFVHDAIDYMASEPDLRAAIETAATHTRPGGAAILTPDAVTETFAPGVDHGGRDDGDGHGHGVRYLEWSHGPNPDGVTHDVDYAFLIHEPGRPPRLEHDRHTFGLFPRATWLALIESSGLVPNGVEIEDPHGTEHVVFVARRPSQ